MKKCKYLRIEQYQLWLGGTPNLQTLAKPYLQRMPIDKLEKTLEPLLVSWKTNGKRTSFGSYIQKIGDHTVLSLLAEGEQAP